MVADVTRALDDVLSQSGPAHGALRLPLRIWGLGELGQIRVERVDVCLLKMRKRRHPLPPFSDPAIELRYALVRLASGWRLPLRPCHPSKLSARRLERRSLNQREE